MKQLYFHKIRNVNIMNAEKIREYCLSKKEVTEGMPFGETVLVFKVCNKIFLLLALDAIPLQFNAKCQPEYAIALRENYDAVIPGYHMNKAHWNTVILDGSLPEKLIFEQIDNSYALIVNSLPKKLKQNLQ
jgi:predicted DNA-binding protein (MmcQ/YjbR family)